MKWPRYILIAGLFLLNLPVWRLIDWAVIIFPHPIIFTVLMSLWSLFFWAFPLRLLFRKFPLALSLIIIFFFGLISWITGPLSNMATLEPSLSHCGKVSYSGFFYPVRSLLSDVHKDDLDVRNQLCWIRKMIQKVPETIASEDLDQELAFLQQKLLKPTDKYRVALPGILYLVGTYLSSGIDETNAFERAVSGKKFMESVDFWNKQYSEEISQREYAWYEWPHSSYIKSEYGFVEKNWENIQLEFNK